MSTVLAFDFGEVRIGVAVGSTELSIAHPLEIIPFKDNVRRFTRIAELVGEWQPSLLIVGFPTHLDGHEHKLSPLIRKFANRLLARFKLPVEQIDEHLSSFSASQILNEMGQRGCRQKTMLDAVAATQILDTWFSTRSRNLRRG